MDRKSGQAKESRCAGGTGRRHPRYGFTLIEMLIVIGVITLVTAILFPALAYARQRARMRDCLSNFKQYSAAFRMYADDYDETLPMWAVDVPFRPGELGITTWDLLLLPYLRDPGASRCPSDPQPAFFTFRDRSTVWRSYSVPRNLIWIPGEKDNPRTGKYPMKRAAIPEPAVTLLMIEKNQGLEVNGAPYPQTPAPSAGWTNAGAFENWQQVAWERHGNRVNALFVDGRVRSLRGWRQGSYRYPPEPRDRSFHWPKLRGYVYRKGAGDVRDKRVNGDQFWEECPIPGEEGPNSCR